MKFYGLLHVFHPSPAPETAAIIKRDTVMDIRSHLFAIGNTIFFISGCPKAVSFSDRLLFRAEKIAQTADEKNLRGPEKGPAGRKAPCRR